MPAHLQGRAREQHAVARSIFGAQHLRELGSRIFQAVALVDNDVLWRE
jgi:hypothetical protein